MVFRLKGIKVNRKIEDIYEYGPKIEYEKFSFNEHVSKSNQKKYEARLNNKNESQYGFDDTSGWEDEEDGSCPAGGELPCMCSDPDPG